jgi:hypothetical protein
MQEQGKRLLLAVALALGVMMLWQVIFPPKKADEPPPTTIAGSGSAGSGIATPAPTPTSRVGQPNQDQPGTAPAASGTRGAEQLVELKYPSFVATFSN